MGITRTINPYIYGYHEPPPASVFPPGAGWIVHLIEVGDNPEPHPGVDLSPFADTGYGTIVRLQYSWTGGGTFPKPDKLSAYVDRVRTCVANSRGCHVWIIGNEPNHPQEYPPQYIYLPDYCAFVYDLCWTAIHSTPGHEDDEVLLPPLAPWIVSTGLDWIEFFAAMIDYAATIDGFALHTYSRGSSPDSIIAQTRMDPPYQQYYNGWQTLYDWLEAIPYPFDDRPIYVTETDQLDPWSKVDTGWVRAMYAELDRHNRSGGQIVRCACLYRWPRVAGDQWGIEGNQAIIGDLQAAMAHGYTWTDVEPPEPPEEDDMLLNRSFEGPYVQDPRHSTVKVAHDWTYFARSDQESPIPGADGLIVLPEYKPLPQSLDAHRVWDGVTAQCWFATNAIYDAGVYQRADAVIGVTYQFDVMGQSWFSNENDPTISGKDLYIALGIDPGGGVDAFAPTVIWTGWKQLGADYQRFGSEAVQAQASAITVFVRTAAKWALKHVDTYIDDAHLFLVNGPPEPPASGEIDYERIRQIVHEELDWNRLDQTIEEAAARAVRYELDHTKLTYDE
jgi:hypothetical protein